MPEFRVATYETEYKRAVIKAPTRRQAEHIALDSLRGERSDIQWEAFDYEGGRIEDIEKV